MKKLSVAQLNHIPGIELTPDLARRGRDISPEHAQRLMDTARHEAAHVVAAWACPNGLALSVYINPRPTHRQRYRSAANADVMAIQLEHEAFISLAGAEMENIMALERGTPGDEESRMTSAHDITRAREECRQIGVEFDVIQNAVCRFMVDSSPALNYMAVAIVLLSTMSGKLNGAKLQRVRDWMRKHILPYDNYGPRVKDKMPNRTFSPALPDALEMFLSKP